MRSFSLGDISVTQSRSQKAKILLQWKANFTIFKDKQPKL